MQEADDGVIEHTAFDALTLERMLQFMYEGDYTVNAATLEVVKESHDNGTASPNTAALKSLPPHLRNVSGAVKPVESKHNHKNIPATNTMTAHVLVYAIAEYYEVSELRLLALKKFSDSKESLGVDEFLWLAKTIYSNTKSPEDGLRKKLLLVLVTDYTDWLAAESFISALANDIELHEFAVAVMSAVFKESVDKLAKSLGYTETQAAATKLLQSDLDQANDALAKSSRRVKSLESDVQKGKSENFKLEGELRRSRGEKDSQVTASNLLLSDLDQANEGLARSSTRVKALENDQRSSQSEISRLSKELKTCKDLSQKSAEQASTSQVRLREANEKLQKETARANKNYDLCNDKDATIKKETTRANSNYDVCTQKDGIIKQKDATINAERTRADRSVAIIKSIVSLVNRYDACRHCGEDGNWRLMERVDSHSIP